MKNHSRWALVALVVSLFVVGLPVVDADATTYPDNIEVAAGTQTGSFPLAIERDDGYVLKVANSSSYQYPSEYWIEEGDQGMTGTFPDDIEEDDSDYIQVADWGQNSPLDEPHTIMHWNWTNVPTGELYQLQHKGYFTTDDPYCSASLYRLYVWDGGAWNLRVTMSDKFGSGNEDWDFYNLTSSEYNSGSPEVYVDALCLIDEQETTIRDFTNVINLLVYREVDVVFEWVNLPMGRQRLDFQAKATGTVTVQVYNGTASDWENLTTISTSWTDYSYELIFDWFNSSNPSLRFYANTSSGTISVELDYVKIVDIYLEKIEDLEDDLEALERELERLRKNLGDNLPDVVVNETPLPTVPSRRTGSIDFDASGDMGEVYRSVVYTIRTSHDSGSNLAFYLPYPEGHDRVVCLSDSLWISGSYSTIWINDTENVLLTTGDAVSYYNAQTCANLTIETSGGTITASRSVDVRLVDFFSWGEDKRIGSFSHTSTVQNDDCAYDWENVLVYWGFPFEESESQFDPDTIVVDMKSVRVWDMSHGVLLTPGRHYILKSGPILELRWVNQSESRTFKIEFTEESPALNRAVYTVRDTDVRFSSVYEDALYSVRFMHIVNGSADFQGTITVKWDLTGTHAGKKLNVSALRIQRSDESGFLEYWYDSAGNELHITDQYVAQGDSVEYIIYFDWYEGKDLLETLAEFPLLLIAAMVMLAVIGIALIMAEEGKGRYGKYQKYLGYGCIAWDAIVLLLLASGVL